MRWTEGEYDVAKDDVDKKSGRRKKEVKSRLLADAFYKKAYIK